MEEKCSQEFPFPVDIILDQFKQYLTAHWSTNAIHIHVLNLCTTSPIAMPSPILWRLPKAVDIASLVHMYMKQEQSIQAAWPALKLILGNNILNFAWAAGTYTTIAFVNIVQSLPNILAIEALEEAGKVVRAELEAEKEKTEDVPKTIKIGLAAKEDTSKK